MMFTNDQERQRTVLRRNGKTHENNGGHGEKRNHLKVVKNPNVQFKITSHITVWGLYVFLCVFHEFIITGRSNTTPPGVRYWTQPAVTQWSPQFALIVTRPWVWPTSKPGSVCPSTRTDTEAWQETFRWSVGIPSPHYPTNPTTPVIGRENLQNL